MQKEICILGSLQFAKWCEKNSLFAFHEVSGVLQSFVYLAQLCSATLENLIFIYD